MGTVIETPLRMKSKDFFLEVEKIVKRSGTDYLDAIIHWCQTHDLEIESVVPLIRGNQILTSKLREQAEDLNILAKSGKLPV